MSNIRDQEDTKVAKDIKIDHKGNIYKSVHQMCMQYGISDKLFKERLSRGYTLKQALETPLGRRRVMIVL